MSANALRAVTGWGDGYVLGLCVKEVDEIRQGANYYVASISQVLHVIILTPVCLEVVDKLPDSELKTSLTKAFVVANLASYIFFPLFAAIKQGDIPFLGEHVSMVCNFVTDQSNRIMRVFGFAIAALSALYVSPYYGAAMCIGLTGEVIESLGYISKKDMAVTLKCLDVLALAITLVKPGFFNRCCIIIDLATRYTPEFNAGMLHKVDRFAKTYLWFPGIKLEEYEAPLTNNRNISFEEIKYILDVRNDLPISMDPAHCSKPVLDLSFLPNDGNFDKLLTHFDKINWESKYTYLTHRLMTDDRFFKLLQKEFPSLSKANIRRDYVFCISELAQKENISNEKYIADWTRNQMEGLVKGLKGEVVITGTSRDLEQAKEAIAKIIPYLDSLDTSKTVELVEFEDCLAKLAIEAGQYCALGLKRATKELMPVVIAKVKPEATSDEDPMGVEVAIREALQTRRLQIVDEVYEKAYKSWVSKSLREDSHIADPLRLKFTLGFLPMPAAERQRIDIFDIVNRQMFSRTLRDMAKSYEEEISSILAETTAQVGYMHYFSYVQKLISSNQSLTEDQKALIIEKINEGVADLDCVGKVEHKLKLFLLVTLGILKKPKIS